MSGQRCQCSVCTEEGARPCTLRTWCLMFAGHEGPCVEVPRYAIAPSDFGPRRAVKR